MQTFLPYPDFQLSAQVLDNKRLGKQRVEAYQILKTLTEGGRWKSHPAVKMWKGYKLALVLYGSAICLEWKKRGFKDTCHEKIMSYASGTRFVYPSWFGNSKFHLSHRSNLVRKNPEFYGPKFPGVPSDLPYAWPSKKSLSLATEESK